MSIVKTVITGVCISCILLNPSSLSAQTVDQTGFEQSTAILDTNVLFAIGAREADQAIRGAFGWPTFQEGFVEGVYFRFDPDGYARFSPSPRLDEDVFEIVCAKASTACIAKKNVLEVGLTPSGEIQIQLSGITPQDSFFVSDRKSELPLPPSILGPLAPRLEALLSGGGDLIIKREVEVIQTISLVGFSAVATYLRWVSQKQSPRVFPRGWPVPAQSLSQTSAGLTQPDQWVPPNSGPQKNYTTWDMQQQLLASNRFGNGESARSDRDMFPRQGGSAGAGGVPLQQSNSQSLAALQSQILALQKSLQGIANEKSLNGNPVNQNLGRVQRSDETLDFGRAFAQQARGRSLPELPGGLGVGGVSPLQVQQKRNAPLVGNETVRPLSPNQDEALLGMQSISPIVSKVLLNRIEQLETSIQMLRKDLSVQIVQIKEVIASNRQLPIAEKSTGNVKAIVPALVAPGEVSSQISSGQSRELLAKLEKKILQRLAAQNQGGVAKANAASSRVDSVAVNRRVLEGLIDELSGQTDRTPSPKTVQNSERKEDSDFVTLDAYINQVLRKEGLEKKSIYQPFGQ